ncbi:MAG: hypothetical protein JXK04_05480 [Campylobacterales bacterium]|nr:hypothetical protein [Campylobacterales bacterium]
MLEIIREAQARFQEIDTLLRTAKEKDKSYFQQLSEATQNAYVVMNEGMCESTTVCHECAENRDFLYSIMGFIEDLASETPLPDSYQEKLDTYAEKVGEILTKIKGALAAM